MCEGRNIVFDIQKFSLHDGPGIRTTVFLKGCPLRCIWCHNPESWNPNPELLYAPDKCRRCGKCADICPAAAHVVNDEHVFDRAACTACGACCTVCPTEALERCGTVRTVDEVMADVLKDLPFYRNSGGGVTFSGGEPMMQFDFLKALLEAAKKANLHTALETCGFAPRAHYAEILPLTDLFLFDVKTVDPEKHRRLTGQDNRLILDNLRFLDNAGAALHLRCPLIPGVNDSAAELSGIGALAQSLPCVTLIEIEPYHSLGVSKARRLGLGDGFEQPFPDSAQPAKWIEQIKTATTTPATSA